MKKAFALVLLLLTACSPLFSNQEIESDCFLKFNSTPLEIFSSLLFLATVMLFYGLQFMEVIPKIPFLKRIIFKAI